MRRLLQRILVISPLVLRRPRCSARVQPVRALNRESSPFAEFLYVVPLQGWENAMFLLNQYGHDRLETATSRYAQNKLFCGGTDPRLFREHET